MIEAAGDYFSGRLRGIFLVLEIMEKYGWDWFKYHSQPSWVIEAIQEKLRIDGIKAQQHQAQQAQQQ